MTYGPLNFEPSGPLESKFIFGDYEITFDALERAIYFRVVTEGVEHPRGTPLKIEAISKTTENVTLDPKYLPESAKEAWLPSVSEAGELSWTKSATDTAPDSVNIQGPKGDTGETGPAGPTGPKGDTGPKPVKGVDYWTEADQEAIVQQVISALGTPVFGRVDADNNIILTGELAEGTYTIKYEDADGNQTEIGTLDNIEIPEIINWIPRSINADGTEYIGTNGEDGYKTGYRLNTSAVETAEGDYEVTGFIPVSGTDFVYFSKISWPTTSSVANKYYVCFYGSDFSKASSQQVSGLKTAGCGTFDSDNNLVVLDVAKFVAYYNPLQEIAYMRISAQVIDENSIISINQPIE